LTGSSELVLDWARRQLDGPVQVAVVKDRPWARTWQLTSVDGVSYLKAAGIATHYEVPLIAALHRVAPTMVAPVLAIRPESGWLLLADAGTTLGEHLNGQFDLPAWTAMLSRFADLQRTAEALNLELITAGVPDERPSQLPDVLKRLLTDSPNLADLTESERRALLDRSARWTDADTELSQLAVPASVQHGDLHPGNLSIGADGLARFFDLGDASIAHPFTTMLVPLQVARSLGADGGQIERLRDSYLDVFTDLATLRQLRHGLDTALEYAVLPKATAWDRALREAPVDHPWGRPVVEYLRDLL
jgi:aminoglycoside phosphotransferase (APT) family kinase protein